MGRSAREGVADSVRTLGQTAQRRRPGGVSVVVQNFEQNGPVGGRQAIPLRYDQEDALHIGGEQPLQAISSLSPSQNVSGNVTTMVPDAERRVGKTAIPASPI